MMPKPFIVIGDTTSHGGRVVSADLSCEINGKAVARVGDLVTCPRKGCRGVFPIVSGSPDVVAMGQAPARHGDKTACGATLIASQSLTTWDDAASRGGAVSEDTPVATTASQFAAPVDSGICLECLVAAARDACALVIRQ